MGNNDSVRFDIIGNDQASGAFSRVGESAGTLSRKMDIAAKSSLVLDEALKRQQTASRASVDATLALAKADDILADAEHVLRDGALEAEYALKKETEAKKKSGDAALEAAAKNKAFADSLKSKGGPSWLGPALLAAPVASSIAGIGAGAALGLGGAAIAGGGALAAFGAIAKPVLADTLKAEQAVQVAQDHYNVAIANGTKQATAYKAEQIAIGRAYAELSPQQIALSQQLGRMASAWQDLKAKETPVVAGALQPWLKSVTDLTGKLAPIIAAVSPVIGALGVQVDRLVNSAAFKGFRDFIANTGSKVVGAVGGTLIDFVKALMVLLPKFNPLILQTTKGIGDLGPAVLKWASSKSTADGITRFMDWFRQNGPAVGQLLKNIGGALKALAPGIGTASVAELNIVSGFFAMIAKLPPGLVKPLTDVAATLLILNKLGVVSVGVKLTGAAAGKFAGTMLGRALLGDAAASAGALVLPVALTIAAIGGLSQIKDKKGGGSLLAPKASDLGFNGSWAKDIAHWFDVARHEISDIWDRMWNDTIGRARRGTNDAFHEISNMRHSTVSTFDSTRHDASSIWDSAWNYLIGRTARGQRDQSSWMNLLWRDSNNKLEGLRSNAASIWNATWNATVSRAASGVGGVTSWLTAMWRNHNSILNGLRSNAAGTWNAIWASTVSRTASGVSGVLSWVGTLPGRITSIFRGAGSWLYNVGVWVIQGLWNGAKSQVGGITSFFSSFASGIVGVFKKIWGWFSPSKVMYEGGKSLMQGLMGGIKDHAHQAVAAASAAAQKVVNAGSGVQRWAGTVAQALSMLHMPASLAGRVLYQMQTESGGNPNAVNNWDINAARGDPSRGLMQVIGSTFAAYHVAGTSSNIYDPLANIAAAINYARNVYGPSLGALGSGHGYAAGTMSAAPGWAWVGERGPELMHFRGGEQVVPHGAARGGGSTYVINVAPTPLARPADIGREVVGAIREHEKRAGKGWRTP